MSDDLFLITGGGTGAKVAEAFVHLCAAGLGPPRAHLLVIDADTTNGNLARARATVEAYQKLQAWPWAVTATFGGVLGMGKKRASAGLFGTELTMSTVTDPIETTDGARDLATAARGDAGLRQAIDLFYDPDEQQATNEDGFRARPNLGCILLADHLGKRLPKDARPFLDALRAAQGDVPVVVTASVFGGTGASLLPTARGVVERALRDGGASKDVLGRLRWGAAMVLPHYLPQKKVESVDPDRYLLDTANALQFYGELQRAAARASEGAREAGSSAAPHWAFDAVYLVGSEAPERNRVVPKTGSRDQANPAYLEEAVAAMGVLDFARSPAGQPVRVFHPGTTGAALGWADLPLGDAAGGGLGPSVRMALLLHLAAFYLRPAHGSAAEHDQGLAALLRQASAHPEWLLSEAWVGEILDPWAAKVGREAYQNAPAARRPEILFRDPNTLGRHAGEALRGAAVGYFARLLYWASTALRADPDHPDLHLLDFSPDGSYARVYAAMADRRADELNTYPDGETIEPKDDNALARALRTALAAFIAEHQSQEGAKKTAPEVRLVDEGRVQLKITLGEVFTALQQEHEAGITETFTKTVPR